MNVDIRTSKFLNQFWSIVFLLRTNVRIIGTIVRVVETFVKQIQNIISVRKTIGEEKRKNIFNI